MLVERGHKSDARLPLHGFCSEFNTFLVGLSVAWRGVVLYLAAQGAWHSQLVPPFNPGRWEERMTDSIN